MIRENGMKRATGYAWAIYKKKRVKNHDRGSHDGIVCKKIASADKTSDWEIILQQIHTYPLRLRLDNYSCICMSMYIDDENYY